MSADVAAAQFPSLPGPTGGLLEPGAAIPPVVVEQPSLAVISIAPDDGSGEFKIPSSAYSLQGFREWALSEEFPDRGQITFSPEGLIIDMSPELLETHNYVKTDLGLTLVGLVRQEKLGRYISDRALFSNEQAGLATEPDALLVSGPAIQSGRCTLRPSSRAGVNIEVLGSPDWVLEVVSPTSIKKDKTTLRDKYFRAGVAEYWIVDALGEEIEFTILVPGSAGYVEVEARSGWLTSPAFGRSFRLTVSKDEAGFAHYTLHVQENS